MTATTANDRITADEVLDAYGAWCEKNPPTITGVQVKSVKRDTSSSLFARYDGDVEDHQILMTLIYEVI